MTELKFWGEHLSQSSRKEGQMLIQAFVVFLEPKFGSDFQTLFWILLHTVFL